MIDQILRIAVVGCGAVTEGAHLPAIVRLNNARVNILIDKNRSRAEELARQYNVPNVAEDYIQIKDYADAAIIALPHYLHAPVSIDLLAQGIHVLVEKPMALSVAECNAMIRASEQGHAILGVGLMRRFRPLPLFTKSILDEDLLGHLETFDIQEGVPYNWPLTSDFLFRMKTAGGGVLIDTGAHTLDTILWWFGDVASIEYFDDSYGGVEADCKLHLVMKSGIRGTVELSRTRMLRNSAIIRGGRASLEIPLYTEQVKLSIPKAAFAIIGNISSDSQKEQYEQSGVEPFIAQLKDWISAIHNGSPLRVSPVEARRSIALIETCYKQRKPLLLPWVNPGTM